MLTLPPDRHSPGRGLVTDSLAPMEYSARQGEVVAGTGTLLSFVLLLFSWRARRLVLRQAARIFSIGNLVRRNNK